MFVFSEYNSVVNIFQYKQFSQKSTGYHLEKDNKEFTLIRELSVGIIIV